VESVNGRPAEGRRITTENTERFTGRAAEYVQHRERYDPDIVLPLLRKWCALKSEWCVADVGAGTGMVGDLFRANGNRVIAIEPNAEMRAACAGLHATDDWFTVADGPAEKTGLADASVEMIAIGRALHWFRIESAFREFRRILKPGGWIAIVACGRTEDGREENVALKELMRSDTGKGAASEPDLGVYVRLDELFQGGEFHHAEADAEMKLNWEGLRGLVLSLSHTPAAGTAGFPAFEAALRTHFERFERGGILTLKSRTWVSAGRFADR
jgi:SAM-dependent methyltransferase